MKILDIKKIHEDLDFSTESQMRAAFDLHI